MVQKHSKNVGREMVEKAGVNVDVLIDKLKKAAAAEFTTYYYYTLLRMHCTGLEGETVKEIAEDARLEDRLHFETLAPRIYELGGELYRDLRELCLFSRVPSKRPQRYQSCFEGVIGSGTMCRARLYGNMQHDLREGP